MHSFVRRSVGLTGLAAIIFSRAEPIVDGLASDLERKSIGPKSGVHGVRCSSSNPFLPPFMPSEAAVPQRSSVRNEPVAAGAVPARHLPRRVAGEPRLERRFDPIRRRLLADGVDRPGPPTWSRSCKASTTLPIMLFSLAAGASPTTSERRGVILVAQVFMLLVSAMLTVLAYLGLVTPWLLLAFTFLIGCGAALHGPAWQSSVGDMVPRSDLPTAVALNSMGFNLARSVGPALGGMIVAAAGGRRRVCGECAQLFRADLRPVPVEARSPPRTLPPETLGVAMGAGLRFVAMSPAIRTVLMRGFLFGLAAIAVQALMPLAARDLVQGGPVTFGLLLGAFGAGAVGGALISSRVRQIRSVEALVRCSFRQVRIVRDRHRAQFLDGADGGRDAPGRGVLGPGPVDVQRRDSACPRRGGWWAVPWRSIRRRPSAAWRSAAGSGACLRKSSAPATPC